jgi:hypothetical protein
LIGLRADKIIKTNGKTKGSLSRLPFEREHGDLGPDTQAAGEGQEAKSTVDVEIAIFLVRQARPIQVTVLHGTPSKVIGLDAELGTVGMTG